MLGGYYLGQLYLGISGLPAGGTLSIQGSSHQLSSDNINLTQKHTIVVASGGHTLTSGNVTLIQKHILTVQDAVHTHLSENTPITSEHFLGVHDSSHGVTSQEVHITQKHDLVVENTIHGLSSGNPNLIEHKTLSVQNASHGHSVQSVVLAVRSYLDVANAAHGTSSNNVTLTQKQILAVQDAYHNLLIDSLGGLINLQPFGMGGGFGAVDGWGIAEWGSTNIELPINYIIRAADAHHELSSDELDTFIQIFNMVRTGDYTKDFESNGQVGSEYTQDTGTMPAKQGSFGQIAPVTDENNGFLIVDVVSNGSYSPKSTFVGNLSKRNSGQGTLSTDEIDTGNYIKLK